MYIYIKKTVLTHSRLFCSFTTPSKKKTSRMPANVNASTQRSRTVMYSFHWPPHSQSSQEYQWFRQAMPSTTSVGSEQEGRTVMYCIICCAAQPVCFRLTRQKMLVRCEASRAASSFRSTGTHACGQQRSKKPWRPLTPIPAKEEDTVTHEDEKVKGRR